MRAPVLLLLVVFFSAACDTPQEIQTAPSNATNTSGTTGSATMTDKPVPAGTGSMPDTTAKKRDSLPR